MNKLLSIITPCYNGGLYISRLLDSILEQTYPHIEMFIVDDGSTDNSKEVIYRYIPSFKDKGYSLTYIFQENSGQSVAINNALKKIHGDYLIWPDSDDFFSDKNILKTMINTFERSPQNISCIRCLPEYIDEKTLKVVAKEKKQKTIKNLFYECLFAQKGFWFVPGNYMIKTSILDKTIPQREIYTEKAAGQNWQIMLPIFYNHECITINKYAYKVLLRKSSHSRFYYSTGEEANKRFISYQRTIINTLKKIPSLNNDTLISLINQIEKKYLYIQLNTYIQYFEWDNVNKIILEIKKNLHENISYKYKIKIILFHIPYIKKIRMSIAKKLH